MQDSSTNPSADRQRLASRARTLAIVYFVILCIATHVPARMQDTAAHSDKWFHFVGYAVLTLCVLAGWELTIGPLEAKHYFAVWLVGTLYGAIDEITQIPAARTCDVNDWAADVLGILCGLMIYGLGRAALNRVGDLRRKLTSEPIPPPSISNRASARDSPPGGPIETT